MTTYPMPDAEVMSIIRKGVAIPAHPLALTTDKKLDERHQRALTRYYLACGVGGVAVGVHTTQFEIRQPQIGLLKPVLEMAAETVRTSTAGPCRGVDLYASNGTRPRATSPYSKAVTPSDSPSDRRTILVAGICGDTAQATAEATLARELGYDVGLMSLAALPDADIDDLIAHAESVAQHIPLMGFYLQPAVGGRLLPRSFWRAFAEIPNVLAVKVAPFNRYHTMDVVRGIAEAGRAGEVALYTGNDDHILLDLVTPYRCAVDGNVIEQRFVGGLLGHWSYWTTYSVHLLERAHRMASNGVVTYEALIEANQITDANAAVFDAANGFSGCLAGINEVLRRQGLLANGVCLSDHERLSPGQAEEIDRVCRAYPYMCDDAFVAEHLDEWLR